MRRLIVLSALLATAAVALSPGVAAGKHRSTIRLWSETVQQSLLDFNEPGPSLGDRFVFSDDLSRRRGGRVIGYTGGECTVVRLVDEFYEYVTQCLVTATLPRGQISVQGHLTFTNGEPEERFSLGVTGGTGRYRGASGTVTLRFVADGVARLRFRLR